jgi:hypothetical protein
MIPSRAPRNLAAASCEYRSPARRTRVAGNDSIANDADSGDGSDGVVAKTRREAGVEENPEGSARHGVVGPIHTETTARLAIRNVLTTGFPGRGQP